MVEVPLINQPNQELNIVLNEQNCTIQIKQLGDYVYLSLWLDDTLIRDSAICLVGQFIIQGTKTAFNGNFTFIDSTSPANDQSQPDYNQFADRFKLLYLTDSEVEEIDNSSD